MVEVAKPLQILLVEDNSSDIKVSQRAFERANAENAIHVVHDGQEALDYVFHRGAYTDSDKYPEPDLIFLDIKLPKLDGFEVLKRIKEDERYILTPIIMLTGSKHEGEAFRSFGNGAVSYVQKPVTHDLFAEIMDGYSTYLKDKDSYTKKI